ncbi:MAG: DUF2191 domain-containing protein [Deltaproteobacteria bacterium]|nr:DUF2191 domain-containing protein [Deltaproteobacteria bacterium]
MKVTAILPDDLIDEIKHYSKGKNITESLMIALRDWIALQKIKELNQKIKREPLKFRKDFSADKVRSINRQLPK